MVYPKDFIDKLKDYDGSELKNKYLRYELFINNYYIGKLADDGFLTRVSRGIYKVTLPVKSKNQPKKDIANNKLKHKYNKSGLDYFETFRNLVLEGNYGVAYSMLIKCVERQIEEVHNNDNRPTIVLDNNCQIYFILLIKILELKGSKINLDYNFDDKLLEFYEEHPLEYDVDKEVFISFKKALLSENYEEASKYLEEYAKKEMSCYKRNTMPTILLKNMLKKFGELSNLETSNMFDNILKLAYEKKYDDVLNLLNKLKPTLSYGLRKNVKYIEELYQTLIAFKNDEKLILPEKKEYNFSENISIVKAFSISMDNKDFLNASTYIGRIKSGKLFHIARCLLYDLIILNEEHILKNSFKKEIDEIRAKTKKNKNMAKIHFNSFLRSLQNLDFDGALEEIKLNLSYFTNDFSEEYQRNYRIYQMLKIFKDMIENKTKLKEINNVYSSSDDSVNLDQAIALYDWKAAQSFIYKVGIGSSLVLEAYDLIIKAILRQDKINREIPLTEEDELKALSNHLKRENEVNKKSDSKQEVNDTVEVQREDSIEQESVQDYKDLRNKDILDRIKNLTLNYETLYELVKNREFEEAFALIQGEEDNSYTKIASVLEEVKEEQKNKLIEEDLEKDNDVVTKEIQEEKKEETVELSEEEKKKQAILDSIKDLELNADTLYHLIYDQKYDEARLLIEREKDDNERSDRLTYNAYRLIVQYQQIAKGVIKEVEKKAIDYTQDAFKIFYAALNNRDYELALEYVDECIECARDKIELELFKLILGDIVDVYNQVMDERAKKENEIREREEKLGRLYDINNELKELSYKQEFDTEDVKLVKNLLQEKVEIAKTYEKESDKDISILGVAEAAVMASNNNLNEGHFATIATSNNNISYNSDDYSADFLTYKTKEEDIFYEALNQGDLLTVYNIITSINWANLGNKMGHINLRLIKNLTVYMYDHMNKVGVTERNNKEREKVTDEMLALVDKEAYQLLSEDERPIHDYIAYLRELHKIVKKRHYKDALNSIIDREEYLRDSELLGNLLLVRTITTEETHAIFERFIAAENNHNIQEALRELNNYKEYIENTSSGRNIDHHYRRLEILKKDLETSNYQEKEQKYLEAFNLVSDRKNAEALEIINEYIAMDKDLNVKGYVLRGRIYYHLKNYEKAKEDYKKALTIAPDPAAYLNLGKMYFIDSDYEKAISYLESYNQIRPFKEASVSKMLVICYNSIGESEKATKYNKHLKYISFLKK